MKQEEAIKRAPVPEARMRLQEAALKPSTITTTPTTSSFKVPRKQAPVVKAPPKTYDSSKDPFAIDLLPIAPISIDPPKKAPAAASTNPFGDDEQEDVAEAAEPKALDSNLNPFE